MLYRAKFVTNSSSCVYMVYGIELEPDQFDKLIEVLYKRYTKEFEEEITEYFKDEDQESLPLTRLEDAIEMIHEDNDILTKFLPKSIQITPGRDYGSYWLDFQAPLSSRVQDGTVVLIEFSAKDVEEVLALVKEAGIDKTTLESDYWEEYS